MYNADPGRPRRIDTGLLLPGSASRSKGRHRGHRRNRCHRSDRRHWRDRSCRRHRDGGLRRRAGVTWIGAWNASTLVHGRRRRQLPGLVLRRRRQQHEQRAAERRLVAARGSRSSGRDRSAGAGGTDRRDGLRGDGAGADTGRPQLPGGRRRVHVGVRRQLRLQRRQGSRSARQAPPERRDFRARPGATGAAGTNGTNGQSVAGVVLPLDDANCPQGGVAYTSASGINYVCNGGTGAAGPVGPTGPAGAAGAAGCGSVRDRRGAAPG